MKTTLALATLALVVALDVETVAGAPAATPMLLDLVGNGIDLGGQTTTSLFGPTMYLRWTKTASDDAFLVIDATLLRQKGYDWRNQHAIKLSSHQIARGGTLLSVKGASNVSVADSWHLLELLDANKDGKLNADDPMWSTASIFNDADANGSLEKSELIPLPVSGIESIALVHAAATQDGYGNSRSDGSYRTAAGATRVASGVKLAQGVLRPAPASRL